MIRKPVTIAVYDRINRYEDMVSPDTFRYTPERGWAWLQRVCFWVLRKLDCRAVDKHLAHVETVEVDQTHISETALTQITKIKRHGGEPEMIITGPEGWTTWETSSHASIQYQTHYREGRGLHRQWYGVPVRIVAGFKGCVVLPKAD